jgi:hypothetical protein
VAVVSNVAAFRAGGQLAAIVPTSFEEVQRLAVMAVKSGLFKEVKRRRAQNDDDNAEGDATGSEATIAKATMAIMQGLEVGLAPMQSIQTIAVINGRCTIWGDAVPALLWARGFKIREWIEGEGDATVAHCEVTRPDGTQIARSFSVADAKRARLWDTREKVSRKGSRGDYMADNDSPWYRFPMRMLAMRARGFAWRDGAADVGRGLYTAEEAEDAEMKDITPKTAEPLAIPDMPDFDDVAPKADAIDESPAQPNAIVDIDALHSTIDLALGACKDAATLAETWNQNEIDVEGLDRSSRQRFYDLYSQHEKRIEAV